MLSETMHDVIYNPDIPAYWQAFPEGLKVKIFEMLFLLLNETFQNQHGEELEALQAIISEQRDQRTIQNKWFSLSPDEQFNFRGCDACSYSPLNCHIYSNIIDILSAIDRENVRSYLTLPIGSPFDYKDHLINSILYSMDKPGVEMELSHRFPVFHYMQPKEKGNTENVIYPAVRLYYPKERLMEDFEKFIDKVQPPYLEKHPARRYSMLGRESKKSDGRRQRQPIDVWERYYKMYVLSYLGKKQKDIALQLFPGNSIGSGEAKVSKGIKKAKELIQKAWDRKFPGTF